jgi:hypothetical protein
MKRDLQKKPRGNASGFTREPMCYLGSPGKRLFQESKKTK